MFVYTLELKMLQRKVRWLYVISTRLEQKASSAYDGFAYFCETFVSRRHLFLTSELLRASSVSQLKLKFVGMAGRSWRQTVPLLLP